MNIAPKRRCCAYAAGTLAGALLLVLDASWASAAPQALRVTAARLAASTGDANGALSLTAVLVDRSRTIQTALLNDAVFLNVRDSAQFNVSLPLSGCGLSSNRVVCSAANLRAELKSTARAAHYVLRVVVQNLGVVVTGRTAPVGPVTLTLIQAGGTDRIDIISDCVATQPSSLECRDQGRPNIVFIVSDDQRWDTLQYMPRTLDRLAGAGVTFTNAFVPTPVCGPSRPSMLTGQYARHHGVLANIGPSGGAPAFIGPDASTLATWLHDAGYRTGMYGKYEVGYSGVCPPYRDSCYRPPGWDEWHVFWTQRYYDYKLDENGVDVAYGDTDADYSTDVITAKAVDFIQSAHGQAFFLHIGYHAPHGDPSGFPVAATRHHGIYTGIPPFLPRPLPPWRPPSWDEDDISDKPPWFLSFHRSADRINSIFTWGGFGELVRLLQLEAALAVDEGIEAIVHALEITGQANNTVIVYISDNGYFWGEHRLYGGKDYPYEESVRVPLIIRYPRLTRSAHSEAALVLSIDIAPTVARLAGIEPRASVDGVDLVPLLQQRVTSVRDDFVLEWWNLVNAPGMPTYQGIRNSDWKYIRYPSANQLELYDLVNDPYELDNRATDSAYQDVVATLQARLDALLAE